MNRRFVLVGALLLMTAARAQDNRINVTGYGVVRVEPDVATVMFGIEGQTDTPALAVERADAISADLVRRLERIGIASDGIRSTPVSMSPFFDARAQRELVRFTRQTTAIIRDLDNVEAVNSAALEAGVNSIGQIEYSATNIEELQNRARALALEDAGAQAEAAASVMGVRVGRVVTISVSRTPPFQSGQGIVVLAYAEESAEYRTGSIEVVESANVSFEIIPQ